MCHQLQLPLSVAHMEKELHAVRRRLFSSRAITCNMHFWIGRLDGPLTNILQFVLSRVPFTKVNKSRNLYFNSLTRSMGRRSFVVFVMEIKLISSCRAGVWKTIISVRLHVQTIKTANKAKFNARLLENLHSSIHHVPDAFCL